MIGPDRFLDACLDLFDGIDATFRNLVAALGAQAYGVVRAFAIAIYVVFAVLAFLAAQRGHRGIGALVVVTIGVPGAGVASLCAVSRSAQPLGRRTGLVVVGGGDHDAAVSLRAAPP